MLDRICKIGISDCKEDEKFRSAYEGMILVSRNVEGQEVTKPKSITLD
jgi:hypothetical protein